MHVGSLAPSTSHPPFLFAGEALHPPLLCALTFASHLFFAGLALHPPSALRPQLRTPPLFCGLSFAGIKGFPKLKSLNAYFLAKIGADTAENEQHFAEILPEIFRRRSSSQTLQFFRECRIGGASASAARRVLKGSRQPCRSLLRCCRCGSKMGSVAKFRQNVVKIESFLAN